MVLWGIVFVYFCDDDDPLWIERYRNIQGDIIIEVSKEHYFVIFFVECFDLVIDNARNDVYMKTCGFLCKIIEVLIKNQELLKIMFSHLPWKTGSDAGIEEAPVYD